MRTLTPEELAALRRIHQLEFTVGWLTLRRVVNAEIRPTVDLVGLCKLELLDNSGERVTKKGLKVLADARKLERWKSAAKSGKA